MTKKTEWTPGIWVSKFDETYTIRNGDDHLIANCTFLKGHMGRRTGEEVAANAHLIAAAPDLYEALAEAELQIEYVHEKFAATGSGNNTLVKIRAALAKARGEME